MTGRGTGGDRRRSTSAALDFVLDLRRRDWDPSQAARGATSKTSHGAFARSGAAALSIFLLRSALRSRYISCGRVFPRHPQINRPREPVVAILGFVGHLNPNSALPSLLLVFLLAFAWIWIWSRICSASISRYTA